MKVLWINKKYTIIVLIFYSMTHVHTISSETARQKITTTATAASNETINSDASAQKEATVATQTTPDKTADADALTQEQLPETIIDNVTANPPKHDKIFEKFFEPSSAPSHANEVTKKPVTFLVYMAADNNLSSYAQDDIAEMMSIGSNNNINILVSLHTRLPGQAKISKNLVIHKGRIELDGPTLQHDSGNPDTLFGACQWAATRYPSDRFVLVLWDHGSGSLNRILGTTIKQEKWWAGKNGRAVCYDDTTGSFLTDADLRYALERFCEECRNNRKIDIVAFDACLMADIEVLYTLAPVANFVVASQDVIPGSGYGYDYALNQAAAGATYPIQFARNIVAAYKYEYENMIPDYTLSASDLSYLEPAVNHVNTIAMHLTRMLQGSDRIEVRNCIRDSIHPRNCLSFDDQTYIDMINFFDNLIREFERTHLRNSYDREIILEALYDGIDAIRNLIVANVKGSAYPQACGLSIYFEPNSIDPTYPELIWSKNTQWLAFLKQYFRR